MLEMRRQASVFVSHSSHDKDVAGTLNSHLQNAGYSTFFGAHNIHAGGNYALEIVRAISSCDALILLLSEAALESPHVQREISLAVDERRTILPIACPAPHIRSTLIPSGRTG